MGRILCMRRTSKYIQGLHLRIRVGHFSYRWGKFESVAASGISHLIIVEVVDSPSSRVHGIRRHFV